MFEFRRAYDRDAFESLLAGPLQRHLARLNAEAFCYRYYFAGNARTIFVQAVAFRFDATFFAAKVFSGECAAREGRPRGNRHPEVICHGYQVAFRRALQQAVFDLQSGELGPASPFGQCVTLAHDPGGCVADRGIVDFALTDEVVDSAKYFFDLGQVIPDMEIKDVDETGLEALEAVLDAPHHILAIVDAGVGSCSVVAEGIFCRDDEEIAVARIDKFPDNLFACSQFVDVGGVKEVATRVGEGFHDREAGVFVGAPAGFGAESHGAET